MVKPYEGEKVLTWVEFKNLIDVKYYPKHVKWANEQELLMFKQGQAMSVMEYIAKFNEFSRFPPVYVATNEIRME